MTAQPDRAAYAYKSLPHGNWTRVLHLDGASKEETLKGWLQDIDLDKLNSHGKVKTNPGHRNPKRQQSEDLPEYEALSWCWGHGLPTVELLIYDDAGKAWKPVKIQDNLGAALKSLRKVNVRRTFWVDAICINLKDAAERAHQVAQMNLVYGKARNVCIWLDESPLEDRNRFNTDYIFRMIETKLLDVTVFDDTIKDPNNAAIFYAFNRLMTKPWFTRRWVIQEIALARKATIHCGNGEMPWESFAHAVALFVKAESTDHQLSKIVNDDKGLNVQDAFWDLEHLGAVALVAITTANQHNFGRGNLELTSTLEQLVALLPTFEAKKSCDTIYALLAIAKDTTPEAEHSLEGTVDPRDAHRKASDEAQKAWKYVQKFKPEERMRKYLKARKVAAMLTAGLRSKTYSVSYTKDPVDVYKQFVEFCIFQSRSLDIICRPWAPKPDLAKEEDEPTQLNYETELESSSGSEDESGNSDDGNLIDGAKDFQRDVLTASLGPTVMSSPLIAQNEEFLSESSSPSPPQYKARDKSRHYMSEPDRKRKRGATAHKQDTRHAPPQKKAKLQPPTRRVVDRTVQMPSWIADRKNAAFVSHNVEDYKRPDRHNANPLVGLPGNKPYKASGTRQVRMGRIQFLRRDEYDQSLFVEGFVLDTVAEVTESASLSNIPSQWYSFVDYEAEPKKSPPAELYRTLIADRGLNGTKPPLYYVRAYHEVIKNRTITLDIRQAIKTSKSVVAEFLERVRQVIFDRQLIKTATPIKQGRDKKRLGLAPKDTKEGDLVCILYGLSVPVILRKVEKTEEDKKEDARAQQHHLPDSYRKAVRVIEKHWAFWKAMEKAIYYMKDPWEEYHKQMPKWREDIRGKFSKLWLDKLKKDLERPKPLCSQRTVKIPLRLDPNLTQEQRDRLWRDMCVQWQSWLDNRDHYEFRSSRVVDKPITAPSEASPSAYYKVVGECYLDGMMDGEALAYKQTKELPDQIFELR